MAKLTLQEQMLKAGLIDKKKLKKAGKTSKKSRTQAKEAKAAVEAAPKYVERKDAATEHLLFLADKAKAELEWIEQSVPPKTDADYREWQDQKLKFAAEMRKLISAMADIGYKSVC